MWTDSTRTGGLPTTASEQEIYYILTEQTGAGSVANQVDGKAYPSLDELHVVVGVSCGTAVLAGGNTGIGDANLYQPGELEYASQRNVAFVYQLEGETQARCVDNK